MTQARPEVGSTANSYVILAKLATGGMAELFLARNASAAGIERYVVLKRVLSHRSNDAAFISMFLDEARLAAQLQHPNVAQVYDTGVLGDAHFFTMEYVHGETVREIITHSDERGQPMPIGCALTIVAGAAAGLHHAHERIGIDGRPLGIVHRDVSPSNLMVSYEGHVKIVDFGVAKAARRSSETQSGTVKGKISYLSPEQCRGRAVDRRSDLFSLGIVTWEMIAGDRLFKRDTDYENMDAIIKEPTPPLASVRPEVPPEVDAVVARMLAKDPADRYQTGEELLEAIERTSVAIGAPLSTASLGRFMRELFGHKPEPWVDLRVAETRADVVTVTASPLGGLTLGPGTTSAQLASIPDLTRGQPIWPDGSPGPAGTTTVRARASGQAAAEDAPTTAAGRTRTRRRRWAAAVIGACVVAGAAISAVIAFGVGAPAGPGAAAASAPRDAGAIAVAAAPLDAPAAAPLDAPAAAPDEPRVVPAATPAHAEHAHAEHAHEHVDHAHVEHAHVDHGHAEHAHAEHAQATPADQLARAFRAAQYGDALALCAADGRLAAQNLVSCILAACHAHDAPRAARWIAQLSAGRRDDFVDACRAAGTALEPARPKGPDCDADPMACRR